MDAFSMWFATGFGLGLSPLARRLTGADPVEGTLSRQPPVPLLEAIDNLA